MKTKAQMNKTKLLFSRLQLLKKHMEIMLLTPTVANYRLIFATAVNWSSSHIPTIVNYRCSSGG